MAFNNDLLIDRATGEIDELHLRETAMLRACSSFGGPNPPPSEIRFWENQLRGMAAMLRAKRRAELGLRDDTVYVNVVMPEWGASGDGFGRAV